MIKYTLPLTFNIVVRVLRALNIYSIHDTPRTLERVLPLSFFVLFFGRFSNVINAFPRSGLQEDPLENKTKTSAGLRPRVGFCFNFFFFHSFSGFDLTGPAIVNKCYVTSTSCRWFLMGDVSLRVFDEMLQKYWKLDKLTKQY